MHVINDASNVFPEPGYYEDGEFGIRLENVLIVKEADTKFNFGDKGYLSFEHITWVSKSKYVYLFSLIYFRGMFILKYIEKPLHFAQLFHSSDFNSTELISDLSNFVIVVVLG